MRSPSTSSWTETATRECDRSQQLAEEQTHETECIGQAPGAVGADVRRVDVPDSEAAAAQRFLGSPTIRVNGRDVEPGADERSDFVLSCRLYRTESGVSGQPDERWLRDALADTA